LPLVSRLTSDGARTQNPTFASLFTAYVFIKKVNFEPFEGNRASFKIYLIM
jgi:hypothetical protein